MYSLKTWRIPFTSILILGTVITLLVFNISCKENLEPRYYFGYADEGPSFSLALNGNQNLTLTIVTTKWEEPDSIGQTLGHTLEDSITGSWNRKNKVINCTFDKPKSSIDSVLIKRDLISFTKKSLLVFSHESDTAFIYGVPCPLIIKQ